MATVNHLPGDEFRTILRPLAESCPAGERNPKDCPLFLLRQMERPQRFEWMQALSEADLVYLATYHHVCLNTKTASKLES